MKPLRRSLCCHAWPLGLVVLAWLGTTPVSAVELTPPQTIASNRWLRVLTPDDDINEGVRLAVKALWDGAAPKAGVLVPTVCGTGSAYPYWIHPYDNYWINRVSAYLFEQESTEWPIRLFAAYQAPSGEIGGGVYDIPLQNWRADFEAAGGLKGWQGKVARPLADHQALLAKAPDQPSYGIYVRDHLYVLQVFDQWRLRGHRPFLIELYPSCRRALKYLERLRDQDANGLVETTAVLSDLVVGGDTDIHSTERAEDQVMLFGALEAFAVMADELGGVADAAWARAWAAKIRTQLIPVFWRPEGRLIFGVRRSDKRPVLEYTTTTFADGYAILFGLTSREQRTAILDFMSRQEFVVPGPYHIPPVRVEDRPQNPPGVYCNGGCGWGRGIMPSVTLACFTDDRVDQAVGYLKAQAAAARKAGSFHEYWTWEKFAGKTEPGGARWYGETSAGYLDALLHGLLGLQPGKEGFTTVKLEPRFPASWEHASFSLCLPNRARLEVEYRSSREATTLQVSASGDRVKLPISVALPWPGSEEPRVEWNGTRPGRIVREDGIWRVRAEMEGAGRLTVRPGPTP
jgi:hypothetical protein